MQENKKIIFINIILICLCFLTILNICFGKYNFVKYFSIKNKKLQTSEILDKHKQELNLINHKISLIKNSDNPKLDYLEELAQNKLKLINKNSYIITNFK